MSLAFLFLAGLMVGSFVNVLAFRYAEGRFVLARKVIGGRSHCPHCHKVLSALELIPLLSFAWQRGRCRSCRAKLSFQYPLVEFLCGLIFASVYYYFSTFGEAPFFLWVADNSFLYIVLASGMWAAVFSALLLLAVIDYRHYLVPDELVIFIGILSFLWVGLLYSAPLDLGSGSFLGAYADMFGRTNVIVLDHILGGLIGALVIAVIFFGTRGRAIGFGDVKLLGVLGLLFGYPDIVLLLVISFVVGALSSLFLIWRREKGMKDFLPFAPFVVIASFLVFIFGQELMKAYFGFFSGLLGL